MASARTASATRRVAVGHSGANPGAASTETVSTARWAGVTLVIGALLSAVVLAVVSPTESGSGAGVASAAAAASPGPGASAGLSASAVPNASAGAAGPGSPVERPILGSVESASTVDDHGVIWTRERELALLVTVPKTELRPKHLSLLIQVNGQTVQSVDRPRDDQEVMGIPLSEHENTITARLASESGEGPLSEPLVVVLDTTRPTVVIRSPRENAKLTSDTVMVTGDAEIGARVTVTNRATGDEKSETIGPSGTFEKVLKSAEGQNRILVTAEDAAGNLSRQSRTVMNSGSQATEVLTVKPARIRVSSLPRTVTVSARITDSNGKAIRGTEVTLTLSVPGGQGTLTFTATTNRDGVVTWKPLVDKPVLAGDAGAVTLVAMPPDGPPRETSLALPEFY